MSIEADIQCYLQCIISSGWLYPIMLAFAITLGFLVIFHAYRNVWHLFGAQASFTSVILSNLLVMTCPMFVWFWIYVGVVFAGVLLLSLGAFLLRSQLEKTVPVPASLAELDTEFGVPVEVLDTSRVLAFVHGRKIYLSVGLLERLDEDEVRAVVAHEAYHAKSGSGGLLGRISSLTSLVIPRWTDERSADRFAARTAGAHNLGSALRKLEMRHWEKRVEALGCATTDAQG